MVHVWGCMFVCMCSMVGMYVERVCVPMVYMYVRVCEVCACVCVYVLEVCAVYCMCGGYVC